MRDCKTCAYARTPDDPYNNGCTAWDCEYIDRKEAIKVYKAYKSGDLIPIKPTNEATILAVNTIISFLEAGRYGETYWEDENGKGFITDMGYLFDGLEEIKKYCEERATE